MKSRFSLLVCAAVLLTTFADLRKSVAESANCASPNVLILFDISGSMGKASTAGSKYNQAVDAIKAVVTASDDKIRYGLKVFPSPAPETVKVYCSVDTLLAVDLGLGSSMAISSYLTPGEANFFGGPRSDYDTPMYQALNNAAEITALEDLERRNYIILITDGIQDCCNGGDYDDEPDCNSGQGYGTANYFVPEELAENRSDLVRLVGDLKKKGINTFVVGFGDGVDKTTLDQMAVAGGTNKDGCADGAAGDCYYNAADKAALQRALAAITQITTSEVCDGLDNDCNGQVDDGINIACATDCGSGIKRCINGNYGECEVPVSAEICDGHDNDCNGQVDDGLSRTCTTSCGVGVEKCNNGHWGECEVPVSAEVCDGQDNDCNGQIDENCDCTPGTEQKCGLDKGRCKPGTQRCKSDGTWGECENAVTPIPEVCDGREDEDCDGYTDEDCKCVNGTTSPCGQSSVGICKMGTQTCQNGTWGECVGAVYGEEDDPCDGLDNDCDGQVDEYCECIEGKEIACGSNQGTCESGTQTCEHGYWTGCKGNIGPIEEFCDGLDNNCDGITDNNVVCMDEGSCRCGRCVSPCYGDTCRGGTCIDGYCILNNMCDEGFFCDGYVCRPGKDPADDAEAQPTVPEGGCHCNASAAGQASGALWMFLGLFLLLGLRWRAKQKM